MVHDVSLKLISIYSCKYRIYKREYFSSVQDFLVSYVLLLCFVLFFASIIKGPLYIGVLSTITVGRLLHVPLARIQLYRVFVFHMYDKFYFRYVIYWTMGGFLNNFRRKPLLYSYKTQSLLAFQGTCMICVSLCQRARTVL